MAKYPTGQRDNRIGSLMAKAAGAVEIQAKFGKKKSCSEAGQST